MAALAIAAGLVSSGAGAQETGADRVAYFQEKNIFHSGLRDTHTIALTFDDGPSAHTPELLDVLKQYNVKATFFIVGKMAKVHPEVLARIAAEGHLLGNHSATHPLLGRRYVDHPELLLAQIRDVNDQIAPLMPRGTKLFFRAPYGSWRVQHAAVLNADPVLKFYTGPIYWDIGGQTTISADGYVLEAADWNCWRRKWDADICAKGYLREIRRKNGGIVLMHCVSKHSAELVAAVLPAMIEEGYKFVRVDQMPAYDKYQTPPDTSPLVASNDGKQHVAAAR